jgi:glucose/arabinose dehydrogenase
VHRTEPREHHKPATRRDRPDILLNYLTSVLLSPLRQSFVPEIGAFFLNCLVKSVFKMRTTIPLIFALFSLLSAAASAQPGQVNLASFSTGYNEPLYVTHAGDERIFVVEKAGRIRICNQSGVKNAFSFLDINVPVGSGGSEQGLLGLAFHPDYKQNGYFYVNYTNTAGNTVISRFSVTANPDVADPASELILMTITQPYSNHNGGCMAFGRDGYLYIGMGDGGSGGDPLNSGQSTTSRLGKMLRLDVNGPGGYAIPYTNPYQGSSPTPDEVWAFGLRNPWRFSFDRANGDLWIGDVGQDIYEEINHLAYNSDPAPNFGWRCYEGNASYISSGCQPAANYDMPVYVFAHSNANGCSITGGNVYRGGRYASLWDTYFFTDYCSGNLWETRPNGSGGFTTVQDGNYVDYEFVSMGEDVYGELYVVAIDQGVIYRLTDTTSAPVAAIFGDTTVLTCDSAWTLQAASHPSLSFQWQLNGADIAGINTSFLSVNAPGSYRVIVSRNGFVDTSATVNVAFSVAPVVSLDVIDSLYCIFDPAVMLTGTPGGGIFVGPGVANGSFNPATAGAGMHQVIYSLDLGNGCADTAVQTVRVDACVGVYPAALLPEFVAYPIPAQELLAFRFGNAEARLLTWELLDIQGRARVQGSAAMNIGVFQSELNVRDLPQGLYLLRLRVDGQTYTHAITIQR